LVWKVFNVEPRQQRRNLQKGEINYAIGVGSLGLCSSPSPANRVN